MVAFPTPLGLSTSSCGSLIQVVAFICLLFTSVCIVVHQKANFSLGAEITKGHLNSLQSMPEDLSHTHIFPTFRLFAECSALWKSQHGGVRVRSQWSDAVVPSCWQWARTFQHECDHCWRWTKHPRNPRLTQLFSGTCAHFLHKKHTNSETFPTFQLLMWTTVQKQETCLFVKMEEGAKTETSSTFVTATRKKESQAQIVNVRKRNPFSSLTSACRRCSFLSQFFLCFSVSFQAVRMSNHHCCHRPRAPRHFLIGYGFLQLRNFQDNDRHGHLNLKITFAKPEHWCFQIPIVEADSWQQVNHRASQIRNVRIRKEVVSTRSRTKTGRIITARWVVPAQNLCTSRLKFPCLAGSVVLFMNCSVWHI